MANNENIKDAEFSEMGTGRETEAKTGKKTEKPSSLRPGRIFGVVLAVIALFVLNNTFYTVGEYEYVVVTEFGRITKVEAEPGLKWKTPFIQEARSVPKRVQVYDIAPSDVITKDKKSMIADDYILWKVSDPILFMQTLNGSILSAQDRCSVAGYNATKNVISSMTQDEIIAARGERLTSLITEDANSDIGEYGLTIIKTSIKALDLPDDNKSAVYERMISERNNIAAGYTANGEAEAQKIRNEADRQVTILEANAKKEAAVLEAEGEQGYMQTLQNAYNSPEKAEFYNFTRSLDAMKTSLSGGEKTIILDKDSEIAKILYGLE